MYATHDLNYMYWCFFDISFNIVSTSILFHAFKISQFRNWIVMVARITLATQVIYIILKFFCLNSTY